ncbi:MAG: LPS export ABC transporter periplasmic protein LptC [Candidatus Hydrogenedentes bacterium]|nr:LPS export ABC transporter periplasmic protein LptC [Candidatus Hydrogenedentota bacterium]
MKSGKSCIVLSLLLVLLGCAVPEPLSENKEETPETTAAANSNAMTMQGIDLYMHRGDTSEDISGKPELWVRAESLTVGDGNTYHFETARAVIYGQEDVEEVIIVAKRGTFEQDSRAVLEGDVTLTAGTLHMILEDIQWMRPEDGTTGIVFSDKPVVIDDPDLQLNSSNLRLHPDTQQFELDDVSGVLRFGKTLL